MRNFTHTNGTIVDAQPGRCVTVPNVSTANGGELILYTCDGGSNQRWTRN